MPANLSLYWGGAMVGRFLGVLIMRVVKPGHLLAFKACVNVMLPLVSIAMAGHTAMWLLLSMAIVGGAILPLVQGALADHIGILHAFFMPVLCYPYIAFYGMKRHLAR